MSKEVSENIIEIVTENTSGASGVSSKKLPSQSKNDDEYTAFVCRCVADQFVKYGGKYYHIDNLGCALSEDDAKDVARLYLRKNFPDQYAQPDKVTHILRRAFGGNLDEPSQTIALWNRGTRCVPGLHSQVIRGEYLSSVNTWKIPDYRQLGIKEADMGMLDEFLDRTFVQPSDKTRFLDWLSWCLQNEQKKPGFAPLLYSREKGTGKSTLCQFVSRLFGKDNTHSANGLSQVTGRFNKPMLDSKLLVLEELKLKPGSNQGNALKSLITEADTSFASASTTRTLPLF